MREELKDIVKGNLLQIKDMLKQIYPKGKNERRLFLFFFLFYLSYSLVFLMTTSVVDHPHNHIDMYFSFDNVPVCHFGVSGYDAHPLMGIYTKPFIFTSGILMIFHYKLKGMFLVILLVCLISMANIFVFRYLREIVGLKKYPLYLLTIFFGMFSTNLVLSFTTESYTISLFLLSFMAYYYSRCVVREEPVRFATLFSFSFLTGGVTITNFSKGIIPYLFTQGTWKRKIRNIILVGVLFGITLLGVQYFYEFSFIDKILWRTSFAEGTKYLGSYYEQAIDLFLGSPIFFSELYTAVVNASIHDTEINEYSRFGVFMDFYHHWWQYLWLVAMYATVIFAIVRNYRKRLMLMILSLLAYDLFLHIVVGYGLGESFIYGGHWVFAIPMLIGWGYKGLQKRGQQVLTTVLSLLFVSLLVNNLYQLTDLYQKLAELYPVVLP